MSRLAHCRSNRATSTMTSLMSSRTAQAAGVGSATPAAPRASVPRRTGVRCNASVACAALDGRSPAVVRRAAIRVSRCGKTPHDAARRAQAQDCCCVAKALRPARACSGMGACYCMCMMIFRRPGASLASNGRVLQRCSSPGGGAERGWQGG
jgi:hypothetical protein